MGAGSSSPNQTEIGDEIFRFAESYLQINDNDVLEKITGMVLNSVGDDSNELNNLLNNDIKELKRRIKESARVIDQNPGIKKSGKTDEPPTVKSDLTRRRKDLIDHFQRLYPAIDSPRVADELLRLNDSELNLVISTPSELKTFIKACSLDEEIDDAKKGATSGVLDTQDQIDSLKEEHLKELSKPEICEKDVEALIGNHLFKRVSMVHPSKADLLTGILMEIERDVVLQLLVSASTLHLNIASVIKKLIDCKKLTEKDIAIMQEELGDLVYSIIERDMEQETACRITGMLLEIDLACLHEVLADEFMFRKRVNEAVAACKSTTQ